MSAAPGIDGITLAAEQFGEVFPFFIAFDRTGVKAVGKSLARLLPHIRPGERLDEHLELQHPSTGWDFDALRRHSHHLCVARCRRERIRLRGQITQSAGPDTLVFLCSPWLTDVRMLTEHGLTFSDFALHDSMLDHLQVLQATRTALRESEQLADRLTKKQEELERARDAAEAASVAKSRFLTTMSHELRTPLNAIIGFSQLLGESAVGELNERQTRYTQNIFQSGRHLLGLINDVLDLAKIEAGHEKLSLLELDMAELLAEVRQPMQTLADEKSIAITYEHEPGLPRVLADRGEMRQIILNLLSNAVKFTADTGRVEVSLRSVERPCSDTDAGDFGLLRFSVTDTGIGIDPSALETVFEEFVQCDNSLTRAQEGTGLGLALVRRLVGMHGGAVWAESPPAGASCGSAFHVLLPTAALTSSDPFPEVSRRTGVLVIAGSDTYAAHGMRSSDGVLADWPVVEDRPEHFLPSALLNPPRLIVYCLSLSEPTTDRIRLLQLKSLRACEDVPIVLVTAPGRCGELSGISAEVDHIIAADDHETLARHLGSPTTVRTATTRVLRFANDTKS